MAQAALASCWAGHGHSSGRFAKRLTEEVILQNIQSAIRSNTRRSTTWGVKIWNSWVNYRRILAGTEIPPSLEEITNDQLNPLPTIVANVIHIDPLFFVCTLQPNRPTHGDVYRDRVIKHVFSQKVCLFSHRLPNKIRKVGAKVALKFLFFPIF